VEYEKTEPDDFKHVRWLRVPDNLQPEGDPDGRPRRPDGTLIWPNVEYYRRLSLAESTNFPGSMPYIGDIQTYRLTNTNIIPLRPEMPLNNQYRPPSDAAKRWLCVYARHIARTYKYGAKPEEKVKNIKIWRVIHEILPASLFAKGYPPQYPTSYYPYYMGEFDADGKLMKSCQLMTVPTAYGGVASIPQDPLLYWLIPIMEVRKQDKPATTREPAIHSPLNFPPQEQTEHPETEIINYVDVQCGDGDGRIPQS
jgi:hypothetical protein